MFKTYKDMPIRAMSIISNTEYLKTGSWRTFKPIIDKEKCTNCGICWKYCPEISIDILEDSFEINYEYCKGCGICANECPKEAISMVEEE